MPHPMHFELQVFFQSKDRRQALSFEGIPQPVRRADTKRVTHSVNQNWYVSKVNGSVPVCDKLTSRELTVQVLLDANNSR